MEFDYEMITEKEFDAISLEKKHSLDEILSRKYPAKKHARKVAQELGVDEGIIYLLGEPERKFEYSDQGPTFRQRRYFFYLSGIELRDCAVTYDIAADHLSLWIPYTDPRTSLWFGTTPTTAKVAKQYDADEVYYTNRLPSFIKAIPPTVRIYALNHDQQPEELRGSASASTPPVDCVMLQPAMDRARVVKDEYEIALVRRANDISSIAHRRVAANIKRMTNELDVEAVFAAVCTSHGAKTMSYPVIAGAGENGACLHYGANDQPLKGKPSLLLDASCEYRCYGSDITRTLPLSGAWTPRAGAIHAIVQRMQDECIARMKPGANYRSIHLLAARIGMEGLLKLGILRGKASDIEAAGTMAAFFPHLVGHHIGLEVHDVKGDVPLSFANSMGLSNGKRIMQSPAQLAEMSTRATRETLNLRAGMILTIEPGIYFSRDYLEAYFRDDPKHTRFIEWDVLERYYPIGGVRVEDCILVTETGYENLSTAPKGDALLDVINGKK